MIAECGYVFISDIGEFTYSFAYPAGPVNTLLYIVFIFAGDET
jgi:hypothetical protein